MGFGESLRQVWALTAVAVPRTGPNAPTNRHQTFTHVAPSELSAIGFPESFPAQCVSPERKRK